MSNPIQFRYRHLSGLHLVGFLTVILFVLVVARFPGVLLWVGLFVLVPLYALLIWRRLHQRGQAADSTAVGKLSRNELRNARLKLKRTGS